MSDSIIITKAQGEATSHKNEHPDYEFFVRSLVSRRAGGKCVVSVYTVPPRKSNFPYHFHAVNEESFYIISGSGVLKTPDGEKTVGAGDFVFCPTGEGGAHKLTNASDTENLVYIDFDTSSEIDVCGYPDSGKLGIYGAHFRELYERKDSVDYYKGE